MADYNFSLFALPVGRYEVKAQAGGFTVAPRSVQDLPIRGRNFTDFIQAADFDARERVTAAYAMTEMSIGERFALLSACFPRESFTSV
jgi:hypothetical protein